MRVTTPESCGGVSAKKMSTPMMATGMRRRMRGGGGSGGRTSGRNKRHMVNTTIKTTLQKLTSKNLDIKFLSVNMISNS
ncbi:UNVERIFIED_CONTAM: hypothetical protein Sangu_1592800 [Sesamum angustifolium]|uniref:Uncharacterized protein n=1 Tax=Sesamum angustifolium TaxID=2727405 RepID=A0AAW2MTE2_9LAMI